VITLFAQLINVLAQLITLLVIISAVLSFFMSPYHPLRQSLDRLVDPMLAPIRRIVPAVGMIDFSPLILIILVQVVATALINLLYSLG
jgi:YggT family protein